jgi:hypothetical protein
MLIDAGADIYAEDTYGKKAADRAKSTDIFYLLSSAAIERRM